MDAPDARRRSLLTGTAGLAAAAATGRGVAAEGRPSAMATTTPIGAFELVVAARAPTTPTGLALSATGRIFLFLPRYDDATVFSAGEVAIDGTVRPYPDADANRPDPARPGDTLFHVPNGVFDRDDRLWLLDAGLMSEATAPVPGAAKLWCVDVAGGRLVRKLSLDAAVVPTSSLNDLQVDIGHGRPDAAYITDQGQKGEGAIVAVDLASGRAVRRLAGHPSTASTAGIFKFVEGRRLEKRGADGKRSEVQGGANGIALGSDGRHLYYAPLMGRRLYRVSTLALLDPRADDAAVAATVEDLGEKGLTGGLLADEQDRIYLTLQEHNALARRDVDGSIETIGSDPRLIWPDTLCIRDGWLYVSSAQHNRRAAYNGGRDLQKPPYAILRTRLSR